MSKIKTESQEQQRLVLKLRFVHPDIPFFAIPNGGKRTPSEARRLLLEGVEKGTPDIFIAVAKKGYHGLFIELKRTKKSKVSQDQHDKKVQLENQGYKVEICYGCDAAYKVILEYIN